MFPAAPPSSLSVPKIEIDFDTPHRDRFLRDEFPRGGGGSGPNRYTVLGRGSYGVVIKARYRAKPVAVKILEKHKKHQCRYDSLRNESNVLNLKHDNIVRVLKIISGAQYGLVIMERFDGHCLQNVLNQSVEISVYHRLMILCDIINGLCFCHRQHIVHLDVKPQNVVVCLVVPGGAGSCSHVRNYTCKLCDFGSSLLLNTININEKSSNRGTIRYMAPEQLRGTAGVTEAADIYSFGITMWQLVEGKDPYDSIASNEAVAYNVVKKKLRPDSVTTVAILRSDPVPIPKSTLQPPQSAAFRARKNSDNSLEIAQSYFRTSSQRSFHSSIRMCSNISGQLPPSVECATAAMSDILKQQGIDLVGTTSQENFNPEELSIAALCVILHQSLDVSSLEQNHLRQEYRGLYRKCWHHEPGMRPSSGDVRAALHGMLERIVCCK